MERDIRPMTVEDMMYVVAHGTREHESFGEAHLRELAKERVKHHSFAGFVNGECVGVGGIQPLWEGVGEAWLMLSNKVALYPVSTFIVIRKGLKKVIDDNDLFRIQSWSRVDFPKAHSLLKHLGFKAEGVAEKYTPDKVDCILYAIVK